MRDFERAYDRALAVREHGVGTLGGWTNVFAAAKEFVEALNDKGWSFSDHHPDLSQDMRELGELSMALAVSEQIAKDKRDPNWLIAKALLKAIDNILGEDAR